MNDEEQVKLDFAHRCMGLFDTLHELMQHEPSPRVWICVLVDMIKKISEEAQNPEAAKKQVIDMLYRSDDE